MFKEIKNKDLRDLIVEGSSNAKLPKDIKFFISDDNKKVKMEFQKHRQIGIEPKADNMQSPSACFEGWAAIIYNHYLKKEGTVVTVILDVKSTPSYDLDELIKNRNWHYGRFLYRALRFSQQYEWFELGDSLKDAVGRFKEDLNTEIFTNNISEADCSPAGNNLERVVEKLFATVDKNSNWLKNELGIKNKEATIHRQLKVGLFKGANPGNQNTDQQVFPGGGAAIDLWTISDGVFYPIELKTNNRMVGAITEIFFYSNFVYDLFIRSKSDPHFVPNGRDSEVKLFNGYGDIFDHLEKLKQVRGFLLFDKADKNSDDNYHPLITDEIINEVLNTQKVGSPDIKYGKISYTLAIKINEDIN